MWTRLRALVARRRIPRCAQCGAMVDVKPSPWLAKYVCGEPKCREQADLEESLGA